MADEPVTAGDLAELHAWLLALDERMDGLARQQALTGVRLARLESGQVLKVTLPEAPPDGAPR